MITVSIYEFETGSIGVDHTHPHTQLSYVLAGRFRYTVDGKSVEMNPGDVINIPANVKHWHGATPDSWFSHLAIEVAGENTSTEWCEKVSDEAYNKLK